jgi:hypothetical protein
MDALAQVDDNSTVRDLLERFNQRKQWPVVSSILCKQVFSSLLIR